MSEQIIQKINGKIVLKGLRVVLPRARNRGWWPHRYRAERATQLVVEYDFDTYRLLRFFGWSSAEITLRYVRLSTRDVLDRMWKGLM